MQFNGNIYLQSPKRQSKFKFSDNLPWGTPSAAGVAGTGTAPPSLDYRSYHGKKDAYVTN